MSDNELGLICSVCGSRQPAPTSSPDAPITAAERFDRERFRQALWSGWYAFLASPDRGNDEQVVNYLCTAGWEYVRSERAERDADARAIVALAMALETVPARQPGGA